MGTALPALDSAYHPERGTPHLHDDWKAVTRRRLQDTQSNPNGRIRVWSSGTGEHIAGPAFVPISEFGNPIRRAAMAFIADAIVSNA